MTSRYQDGIAPSDYTDTRTLVVCPRCSKCATVVDAGGDASPYVVCEHCGMHEVQSATSWKGPVQGSVHRVCPRCRASIDHKVHGPRHPYEIRVTCTKCGMQMENEKVTWHRAMSNEPRDSSFGLRLWLTIPVGGEVLWAVNREHLGFLRDYISASLRERGPTGTWQRSNRLPKWMLEAKNRDSVLKAIRKLSEKP